MPQVEQVLDGVFCISSWNKPAGIVVNQYVILDEQPTLISLGGVPLFPEISSAVRQVIDPTKLRYAFISHFEADECGGVLPFMQIAPNMQMVCSAVTGRQLMGFGMCRNALVKGDGDTLELGRRRLRFIDYPSEMHLWNGLLAFEETEGVLYTSDLFLVPGPVEKLKVTANPEEVLVIPPASIPSPEGRSACLERIKGLAPRVLALGHGPVLELRQ